jgi:hypothetical protein
MAGGLGGRSGQENRGLRENRDGSASSHRGAPLEQLEWKKRAREGQAVCHFGGGVRRRRGGSEGAQAHSGGAEQRRRRWVSSQRDHNRCERWVPNWQVYPQWNMVICQWFLCYSPVTTISSYKFAEKRKELQLVDPFLWGGVLSLSWHCDLSPTVEVFIEIWPTFVPKEANC